MMLHEYCLDPAIAEIRNEDIQSHVEVADYEPRTRGLYRIYQCFQRLGALCFAGILIHVVVAEVGVYQRNGMEAIEIAREVDYHNFKLNFLGRCSRGRGL